MTLHTNHQAQADGPGTSGNNGGPVLASSAVMTSILRAWGRVAGRSWPSLFSILKAGWSRRPGEEMKAANPNIKYMGFEHLTHYNNSHPDELHKAWMKRTGVRAPGTRGRKPGTRAVCTRCGRKGHYKKTCKYGVDIQGDRLW